MKRRVVRAGVAAIEAARDGEKLFVRGFSGLVPLTDDEARRVILSASSMATNELWTLWIYVTVSK